MKKRNVGSTGALCALLLFALAGGPCLAAEKTYTNGIGMEFALIPAGSFMMGADKNVEDARAYETPRHKVTIGKAFYLGRFAVTQAEWVAVMGHSPSKFKGRDNPVEQVSWDDAQEFIRKLNQREGTDKYRLPTEAEWEYAARAGSETAYSFGDDAGELGRYAWYEDNSGERHHPVGKKEPNAWGLYDMHGNVYEWVQDWYGAYYYRSSPAADPQGPSSGSFRVVRGGCWYLSARNCRSAYRSSGTPGDRHDIIGFRLALSLGQ